MENQKIRIDLYLVDFLKTTRSNAQKLIANNCVKVNNCFINKNNFLIDTNKDKIEIFDNNLQKDNQIKDCQQIKPFKKEIKIVYQDETIFIVNKESGLMVHPTNFNEENTLANIIKYYVDSKKIKSEFNDNRMGIVHRLDKDTSGLIVVAKTKQAFELISNLFKENKIDKTYSALLVGNLESKQIDVDAPIKRIDQTNKRDVSSDVDAKDAFSSFYLIKQYENFCLSEIKIKTGRTHQIRVHAKYIKHNVINDPIYGISKKTTKYGQYLAANKIKFINPINNKLVNVSIELPNEFNEYIKKNGR